MNSSPVKPKNLTGTVRRRVRALGPGSVVSPSDFLHPGSRVTVDQVLSRLTKEGILHRLRRGLYYYQAVNKLDA